MYISNALILSHLCSDPSSALISSRIERDCIVTDSIVNPGQVSQSLLFLILLMLRQLSLIPSFHFLFDPTSFLSQPHLLLITFFQHLSLISFPLLFLDFIHHQGTQSFLIDSRSNEFILSLIHFFLSFLPINFDQIVL